MRVLGVHCRRCLERSESGAELQFCDCGFVLSRVRRCCDTAQRCVGLIVRVCASRCAAYTRALPPHRSGCVVRCCACVVGGGGGGNRWQSVLRTSATRVL
jgi:hypothetical protein